MRALLVQLDIAWENRDENHRRVRGLLADVAPKPGDLIVLPEMFDSGFSLNIERTADEDGRSRAFLASLARERESYVYAGITLHRPDGMGLNRAIILTPSGETACEYDKLHPFSFGREPERFAPGERGVVTCLWESDGESLTLCPAVCYDLRFPELFRVGLGKGAEAFVIGANWPSGRDRHWRTLLEARAIENQAFVLAVNRVGKDPHLAYTGGSAAFSPTGERLTKANANEPQMQRVVVVGVDPSAVRSWRTTFPACRDRRVDLVPD